MNGANVAENRGVVVGVSKFRKAERKQAFLRLGITGPAGSGKTRSALEIAYGITGNWDDVAMIDTEHRSGDLYAELGSYSILSLDPPYTVDRYIEAMKAAEANGFKALIIDSASHEWSGQGGILEQKDALDARGGNSYTNWAVPTKNHQRFINAILESKMHIIATLRSTVEYVLTENDRGKKVPQKTGMKPIQREGVDYELTIVLDMDMAHQAVCSKDRTNLFKGGMPFIPNKDTGKTILQWLNSGAPMTPVSDTQEPVPAPSPAGGAEAGKQMVNNVVELPKPGNPANVTRIAELLAATLPEVMEKSPEKYGPALKNYLVNVPSGRTELGWMKMVESVESFLGRKLGMVEAGAQDGGAN